MTVEVKDRYLAQLYADLWAKHLESLRLGLEQSNREWAWPSTSPNTVEGQRGATSPLGGTAIETEKEPR